MDPPECSLQDVLRCHLCETHMPCMYCDICQIDLCKPCVGEHISDESKEHKVVPFQKRRSTPKCPKHSSKQCGLYCEQCDIPICLQCISSAEHEQHKKTDAFIILERKKNDLQKDLQELEKTIYPIYQEIASTLLAQREAVDKSYKKVKRIIDKQERDWHRDIDTIVTILRDEADKQKSNITSFFDEQEGKIKHSIDEIRQIIVDIRKIINSNDAYVASSYKSRNDGFRRLPDEHVISPPRIYPYKIKKEPFLKQSSFYSMKMIAVKGREIMNYSWVEENPTHKPLMHEEPMIISYIETGSAPCNVSRLSDEEIWVSGRDNILRLYNLEGHLVRSIQTKSGNVPTGLAVTRSGDVVYTDSNERTVNVVKNTLIETVIRLQGWIPRSVCGTSSDDILVIMDNDDVNQAKVVRYSVSKESQSIQYDNKGNRIYPLCYGIVNITENRNLDICVSDNVAREVIVVNKAGELRFRYTGDTFSQEDPSEGFNPCDITTDNQCRILISESDYRHIRIIDQDGQFLRYIDNCELTCPTGICIDTEDNLFIADEGTCEVKGLEYYIPMV